MGHSKNNEANVLQNAVKMAQKWYISDTFQHLTWVSHRSRINSLHAIFLSCLIIFGMTHMLSQENAHLCTFSLIEATHSLYYHNYIFLLFAARSQNVNTYKCTHVVWSTSDTTGTQWESSKPLTHSSCSFSEDWRVWPSVRHILIFLHTE